MKDAPIQWQYSEGNSHIVFFLLKPAIREVMRFPTYLGERILADLELAHRQCTLADLQGWVCSLLEHTLTEVS